MEPFTICVTETVLVCLATNAVLLWKYQSATSQSRLVSEYGSKRREKMFHIDETPKVTTSDHTMEGVDFAREVIIAI